MTEEEKSKHVDTLYSFIERETDPNIAIINLKKYFVDANIPEKELATEIVPRLYLKMTNNNPRLDIRLRGHIDTLPIKLMLTGVYKESSKWPKHTQY